MAKYYVSCGEIRQVLNAQDAESAALEALSQFLEPHDWIFDCSTLSDADRRAHLAFEVLTCLDAQVVVSQRGYRSKASTSRMVTPLVPNGGLTSETTESVTPDPVFVSVADLLDTYFRLQKAISRYATHLLCESTSETEYEEEMVAVPSVLA